MAAKYSGANKSKERDDMVGIVFGVDLDTQLRSKIEADIKGELAVLGVPIANTDGQVQLLTGDRAVNEIRVPVEYANKVRKALTDALETRGLQAVSNGKKGNITIIRAPSEDQRKAAGY
ncbi:hypothetical protein KJ657_04115 [Patescibacteria group bacterium]|nr:hypothetical protein [Patescibacteria group bacterium]MBU1016250.1 hypothetical protein [Patescibacteria group bacterium]MBU1685482.1 hypothetical protein [Patescibacteria group bacterium]MBU1939108.1 hypothetical protein [Patescibacteria group bacterium]